MGGMAKLAQVHHGDGESSETSFASRPGLKGDGHCAFGPQGRPKRSAPVAQQNPLSFDQLATTMARGPRAQFARTTVRVSVGGPLWQREGRLGGAGKASRLERNLLSGDGADGSAMVILRGGGAPDFVAEHR